MLPGTSQVRLYETIYTFCSSSENCIKFLYNFFPPCEQNLLALTYISAVLSLEARSELFTDLSFWTFWTILVFGWEQKKKTT